MSTEITLTDHQNKAKNNIINWYFNTESPVAIIQGAAGTGKSTITKTIVNEIISKKPKLHVVYLAPTGAAAQVLRKKGVPATTIHSFMYRPVEKTKEAEDELRKTIRKLELSNSKDPKVESRIVQLKETLHRFYDVSFSFNCKLEFEHEYLVVCDEASMITKAIREDMKKLTQAYNLRIIFIGDRNQLPPVEPYNKAKTKPLMENTPTAELTQIMRQSLENPIIRLSQSILNNEFIRPNDYSNGQYKVKKVERTPKNFTVGEVYDADACIVGKNITRFKINTAVREYLVDSQKIDLIDGYETVPVANEKCIITKNNNTIMIDSGGVFNGQPVSLEEVKPGIDGFFRADITTLDNDESCESVMCYNGFCDMNYDQSIKPSDISRQLYTVMQGKDHPLLVDFAYAITCHKSQGQQFESVIVREEPLGDTMEEKRKWMYTAITRATKHLTIYS